MTSRVFINFLEGLDTNYLVAKSLLISPTDWLGMEMEFPEKMHKGEQ